MFDLIIAGARIVADGTLKERAICISGGTIAAVLADGALPAARETVDAAGRILLPGLVDAHVHFREPGLTAKEDVVSGSQAAAAGGVTTVMIMPTDNPLTATPETFVEKRDLGTGRCHVDFAVQAGLGRDTGHVRALADLGAISFELFQTGFPGPLNVDDAVDLVASMAAVREVGGVMGVTPGHAGLLMRYAEIAKATYGTARAGWGASWPPEIEAMGIASACLAAGLTGTRVHFRQVSCARGLAALMALRTDGISAEVTPHNLVLDESVLMDKGPVAKIAPPLRPAGDMAAMQAALARGQIDIVATDHAPHRPEEKAAGEADIWLAPGGFPGVQTMLPVLLRLVGQGVIDYPRLVEVAAAAPARLFGLYPRKGAIAVGSDADLVLVDPDRAMTIRDEDQISKAGRSPFHGLTAPATPVAAWLRGQAIMQNGRPVGSARGQFVRPS